MNDLSWAEWSSLPRGRSRAEEHQRQREWGEKLNREAKAEHHKKLIEGGFLCKDLIAGKILICGHCKHPKNCLNDPEWMKKYHSFICSQCGTEGTATYRFFCYKCHAFIMEIPKKSFSVNINRKERRLLEATEK